MAQSRNLWFLIPAGALAALLLTLSALSLLSSTLTLPFEADLERIRSGQPISDFDAMAIANANERAALFFESGRYRANEAAALFALSPRRRRAVEARMKEVVEASLKAAPASPYNWNRLAYLRFRTGDRNAALAAWQMSILVGRYTPGLMGGRLVLGLRMLPSGNQTFIGCLVDQISLLAQGNTIELARAARTAHGESFVRAVLWRDPGLFEKFEAAYKQVVWMERATVQ